MDDLYDRFKHLLDSLDLVWLDPELFSQVVNNKGAPINKCCGFTDGTATPHLQSVHNVLLHPSPTDSRNTGAYVARPRPGYHNIKEKMCMRYASSFRGAFGPPRFLFSLLIGSVFLHSLRFKCRI